MEKKELLEEMLKEEFDRLAKEEEDAIQKEDISMPEGMKEDLYAEIQDKIHGAAADNIYAQLSEEDLKALELGRKIMEEEARAEREAKTVRKKKRVRMYVCLAAALVLAMALGVTSMGGPERIIQMMTRMVGDREVDKITVSDDIITTIDESEEEAYQKIKEEFGIEPVRVWYKAKKMIFKEMKFDKEIQTAELYYKYNNNTVVYLINASYITNTSWGIDAEDEIINSYEKEIMGCMVEIKEYSVSKTELRKYSANFKYKGLEYYLIGTIGKDEFENIINNLFFY